MDAFVGQYLSNSHDQVDVVNTHGTQEEFQWLFKEWQFETCKELLLVKYMLSTFKYMYNLHFFHSESAGYSVYWTVRMLHTSFTEATGRTVPSCTQSFLDRESVATWGHPVIMFCNSPALLKPPQSRSSLTEGTRNKTTVFAGNAEAAVKMVIYHAKLVFPGVLGQWRLSFRKC